MSAVNMRLEIDLTRPMPNETRHVATLVVPRLGAARLLPLWSIRVGHDSDLEAEGTKPWRVGWSGRVVAFETRDYPTWEEASLAAVEQAMMFTREAAGLPPVE